eukprot:CAMPEP_0184527618 /NCGR_PEP_ID=MMETSP0198_2-20121128/11322_1 /TAXON_ID=1112570 /ORGANISM="Thraustochytrium sp., Strain LLF1b" /LENGTH=492 /DNA_ID=CAMNT_0026919345 /DNA_START=123 /DNA_END=1601 /DNA_ORIENTATION=-
MASWGVLRRAVGPSAIWPHRGFGALAFSTLPQGATAFPLPALSPTMTSGGIGNWLVKEMESFNAGQALCEIETDKASMECEAMDDGVMARILAPAGSKDIEVGTAIAVIAEDEAIAKSLSDMDLSFLSSGSGPGSGDALQQAESSPVSDSTPEQSNSSSSSNLVSPAAAFLLRSYGVDPSTVPATQRLPSGRSSVVTKASALQAIEGKSLVHLPESNQTPPRPAAPSQTSSTQSASPTQAESLTSTALGDISGTYDDIPLTTMRKVIAKRLTESKQSAPHVYASIDCEIDEILALRTRLKKRLGKAPSINDIIIKASALALRDVPRVNCRLDTSGTIVQNDSIDIAVAVATPTGLITPIEAVATPTGLITPIVKTADTKGVTQITEDMRDLATRAKANKLKLDEFQGGSFTVSNLGMFGIKEFTAIISPPQSAILAVGGGRKEFAMVAGETTVVNVLTLQISCNRKVIDEATAGRFLQSLRHYLEEPENMFL